MVDAANKFLLTEDFEADTILAKHDENYMAPEVAESMAEHVSEQTAGLAEGSGECDVQ